jgi:hypothetical protein
MEKEKFGKLENSQREKLISSVIDSLGENAEEIEEIEEIFEDSILDLNLKENGKAQGKGQGSESESGNNDDEKAEVSETANESALQATGLAKKKPFVRRIYVTLAAIMIIFSIIGAVNSFIFINEKITYIRERQELKDEFAAFIYPVVINDPPNFNSVDDLQSATVVRIAIWKIILTGDMNSYNSDAGVIYIPAVNVEAAALSLFGIGKPEHKSTSYAGMDFRYNDENKNYAIPENAALYTYLPVVSSVTNVGELYTVTVDYFPPNPIAGIAYSNEPLKTLVYTISRGDGKKTINSIQPFVSTE